MPLAEQRRLPVPDDARIKTYYDTQQLKQNEDVVNFFTPNPDKSPTRNNYVSNPFPGQATRRIAGISFELVRQFITDAANIDSRAIVNAIKHAGVIISADQSYTEFLRAPIGEYSNFSTTGFEQVKAKAYVNAAYVDKTETVAVLKRAFTYRLDDPFDVAANQNLNVSVHFKDASVFPTDAQWTSASQPKLWLRASLYLAEIAVPVG